MLLFFTIVAVFLMCSYFTQLLPENVWAHEEIFNFVADVLVHAEYSVAAIEERLCATWF
jgi:hypothetical protein